MTNGERKRRAPGEKMERVALKKPTTICGGREDFKGKKGGRHGRRRGGKKKGKKRATSNPGPQLPNYPAKPVLIRSEHGVKKGQPKEKFKKCREQRVSTATKQVNSLLLGRADLEGGEGEAETLGIRIFQNRAKKREKRA